MGGKSSATSQTTQTQDMNQSTQSNPWEPAQGLLTGILGQANSQLGNTQLTGTENSALNTLAANANNPFAGQISDFANSLLSGGGANAQAGNISGALDTYKQQLNPFANGSMVGQITPQMQGLLDTIRNDISGQVNGQFAAAGRDFSGMNQQALARGISQGMAAPLLNQYNQDVQNQINASGALYGAGNTTAGLLSGLNQTALGNQAQGVTAATSALDARNYGANQMLAAEQARRGIPMQNLGLLAQLGIPIAGLGGTSKSEGTMTGTSNTNQTKTLSPAEQAWGWMSAAGSMFAPRISVGGK